MKINELRTLIREEIQNELAEAKKKKKKEAKEKIMEIITEAELTEEELEEAFFGLVGGKSYKKGDPAKITSMFKDDKGNLDLIALAKEWYRFYNQPFDDNQKAIALSNLKDKTNKEKLIQSLANLGSVIGYENIKTTKVSDTVEDIKGNKITLTPAFLGDKINFYQFGAVIKAGTKPSGKGGSGTDFGE